MNYINNFVQAQNAVNTNSECSDFPLTLSLSCARSENFPAKKVLGGTISRNHSESST